MAPLRRVSIEERESAEAWQGEKERGKESESAEACKVREREAKRESECGGLFDCQQVVKDGKVRERGKESESAEAFSTSMPRG